MKDTAKGWKELIRELEASGGQRAWVEECEPLSRSPQIRILFTWGIFNPFGPTLSSLALVRPNCRSPWVLYYRMSHPTCRSDVACGLVNSVDDAEIEQLCRPLFTEGTPLGTPLEVCLPTLVLLPARKILSPEVIASFFEATLQKGSERDLAGKIKAYLNFWLDPWKRADASVRQCFANLFSGSGATASGPRTPAKYTSAEFFVWWKIVTYPEHVRAELEAVQAAWCPDKGWFPAIFDPVTWIGEVYDFHVTLARPARR
ncbi:MAG: hypothetical protein N2438_14265 [Limisphaera sp.]|nr:hypothetical protein [Limisphaera sp.]